MSGFRYWLQRLLGLRAAVEDQVEQAVRLDAALAGAVIRAQTLAEAEAAAAEMEPTNPALAAALRAAIGEHARGLPAPATLAPAAPAPDPVPLPGVAPKRGRGRPRKLVELPPPSPPHEEELQ